ncbi:cold shock domain-containing protein [Pelomonas sp. SE-A7]|uniref:cold-shock protein n=1 Tax=Pelomonas sp. SE-A7 TaxID=3054953 RepID=UPI00259D0612|nr:cold shock domain-containing protein [Pelomonas sp. SE-A7]MDM4766186.1 cold shock domain-containing protein [Pelomonas sp. SE-A7]
MRFEGKLKTWNDDQGVGSIEPQDGGEPLFVRISAFPGDAQMPQVGERLSFEVDLSPSGRKQAARVQRLARSRASASSSSSARQSRAAAPRRNSWMFGTAAAVLVATLGGLALMRHYEPEASAQFAALNAEIQQGQPTSAGQPEGKPASKAARTAAKHP